MESLTDSRRRSLVLLTGATGYIGGRLLKALEKAGWPVRCLARRPEFLRPHVAPNTEVVKGDCLDQTSLIPALVGVHTVYYLVHSMGSSGKFEDEDRQAASNFAAAARQAGVCRIIYLGGLGAEGQALFAHLRSRQEVADILRSSGIPTVEFRVVHRDWLRKPLLRNDSSSGAAPAGDDLPALGRREGSADRCRGRNRLLSASR